MNPQLCFEEQLKYLNFTHSLRHHAELTAEAAREKWSHAELLRRFIDAETAERQQRALERRLRIARSPVRKSLDQFQWDWPKKINEAQVRHLFELRFVAERANVVFCGGVGLGKTHLATALGFAACQAGHSVLFTTAVDAINALVAGPSHPPSKYRVKEVPRPGAAHPRRDRLPAARQSRRRSALPARQPTLRTRLAHRHHQQSLQALAEHLQQRRRDHRCYP